MIKRNIEIEYHIRQPTGEVILTFLFLASESTIIFYRKISKCDYFCNYL
ncbi:hypothetical protein HMPREF0525_01495 [Lactobacillus jensenii 27-2-CHN]|nr:hypothetical protein HMPREF0525_01495 [Lactobacillus jensenii 27-2-CHN]